jgi:hypothetical protein
MDFILGHNASPDPVGDLLETIVEAKEIVRTRGGYLSVVASVCGTDEDPQDLKKQVDNLKRANVLVLPTNVQATIVSRDLLLKRSA